MAFSLLEKLLSLVQLEVTCKPLLKTILVKSQPSRKANIISLESSISTLTRQTLLCIWRLTFQMISTC